MTRLTDTQAILLSTASQREGGIVLPLAGGLKPGGGTSKALAALLGRGLVAEGETTDPSAAHRVDGDLRFGLFLTPAGASAIGIKPSEPVEASDPAAPTRLTKAAAVLALLARVDGATLPELIEATGWLPHTTRAALTGLRKQGHQIARGKRDGATCYTITEWA